MPERSGGTRVAFPPKLPGVMTVPIRKSQGSKWSCEPYAAPSVAQAALGNRRTVPISNLLADRGTLPVDRVDPVVSISRLPVTPMKASSYE